MPKLHTLDRSTGKNEVNRETSGQQSDPSHQRAPGAKSEAKAASTQKHSERVPKAHFAGKTIQGIERRWCTISPLVRAVIVRILLQYRTRVSLLHKKSFRISVFGVCSSCCKRKRQWHTAQMAGRVFPNFGRVVMTCTSTTFTST